MRDFANENSSQYRCVEATLFLRAVAQRLNKVAKRLINQHFSLSRRTIPDIEIWKGIVLAYRAMEGSAEL